MTEENTPPRPTGPEDTYEHEGRLLWRRATGEDAAPRTAAGRHYYDEWGNDDLLPGILAIEAEAQGYGEPLPTEGPHLHSTVGELIACHTRTFERAAQGAAARDTNDEATPFQRGYDLGLHHGLSRAAQGAAAPPRYRAIAARALGTLSGIARDSSVESLRDARRVASRAFDDGWSAIAEHDLAAQAAAAPDGPERLARLLKERYGDAAFGLAVGNLSIDRFRMDAYDILARLSGASTDS